MLQTTAAIGGRNCRGHADAMPVEDIHLRSSVASNLPHATLRTSKAMSAITTCSTVPPFCFTCGRGNLQCSAELAGKWTLPVSEVYSWPLRTVSQATCRTQVGHSVLAWL